MEGLARKRKHYSRYDDNRAGWCVFKKDNELISRFHAGPFDTKQHADSEAERLNDIIDKEIERLPRRGNGGAEVMGWEKF